jgi:hypothetical protein
MLRQHSFTKSVRNMFMKGATESWLLLSPWSLLCCHLAGSPEFNVNKWILGWQKASGKINHQNKMDVVTAMDNRAKAINRMV